MPSSSVGGRAGDRRRAAPAGRARSASNVSAIAVNPRASVPGSGARDPRRVLELLEEARPAACRVAPGVRITGGRSPSSSGSAASVRLSRRAAPGEPGAEVLQVPIDVLARAARRRSRRSRRARGRRPARSRSATAPSAQLAAESPRTSSTYFRPSAERGRMRIVESAGIGEAALSSFSVSSAPAAPPARRTGTISVTCPMRKPPSRTSLPTTSRAASGASTLSS